MEDVMFIKNTLVIFPWTKEFNKLSTCPNVKRGNFRIGQLIFRTTFQKSWLIIAKQDFPALFKADDVVSDMSRKIASADSAYLDGMTCPRDYINQLAEIIVEANNNISMSSCDQHCELCPAVCTAKKGN